MNIIKKIDHISEVKKYFMNDKKRVPDNIIDVFQNFIICKKVQELGEIKKKGVGGIKILTALLIMPFIDISSIRALIYSGNHELSDCEKDTIYRFKNNENVKWRSVLYSISKRFFFLAQNLNKDEENPSNSPKCFIADDTLHQKTGKKIENIGKVFDHTQGRPVLGFKNLVLSFSDGKNSIPIDFSLHNEKGKNKKRPFGLLQKEIKARFSKKRPPSSPGFKRKQELRKSKIDSLINMVKRAVKHGFKADYLLTDSWFPCEKLFTVIQNLKEKIHFLGPMKTNRHFVYKEQSYSASQLRRKLRKKIKRCRRLNCSYIKVNAIYKGHKVCLFFNRSFRNKKWNLIVSTDRKLSFIKAIEIYSIRWTIEVYFKEGKQYFNLGKSQARNFDSQIADTTISMIQYIMMAYLKRSREYETIGGIFADSKKFINELTVAEKIWGLLNEIMAKLSEIFELSFELVLEKLFSVPKFEEIVLKFIEKDLIIADGDFT